VIRRKRMLDELSRIKSEIIKIQQKQIELLIFQNQLLINVLKNQRNNISDENCQKGSE
jgi:hypothetical protein